MRILVMLLLVFAFCHSKARAESLVDGYFWAEEKETGMNVFLGDNLGSNKVWEGMKEGADGKLRPTEWPTMLRSKPFIYFLTSEGAKKAIITGVEVSAVGSLVISTDLYARDQAKRDINVGPRKGLAKIGKAFASGARLRNLVDKSDLPAEMSTVPQKIHAYVREHLKKEKAFLQKFQVRPEDYSFAEVHTARGKLWLSWFSRLRHMHRVNPNVAKELVFAALVDGKGSVVEVLRGPKMKSTDGVPTAWNIEEFNPVFAVDLVGNAKEEIVAEVPYYEGYRVYRYRLKPKKGVEEITLPGL